MPVRTESIVIGDMFTSNAEIIVIPHSTAGTINDTIEHDLERIGITSGPPTNSILGEVVIKPVDIKRKPLKFVAYACSVDNYSSTYAAIWRIAMQLAKEAENKASLMVTPILGSGAGGLDPVICYFILSRTFKFYSSENSPQLVIYSKEERLREEIDIALDNYHGKTGRQIAFDASIRKVSRLGFNEETRKSDDFYFSLATEKLHQFKDLVFIPKNVTSGRNELYNQIIRKYQKMRVGLIDFMNSYEKDSMEYNFILLCAELIAYIDGHALNIQTLNKYKDNRTVVRTDMTERTWFENLLRYKANNEELTPSNPISFQRALEYLLDPMNNVTMFSDKHREQLSRNIFSDNHIPAFDEYILKYFREEAVEAKNPMNQGALVGRVLYTPEVEELWMDSPPTPTRRKSLIGSSEDVTESISDSNNPVTAKSEIKAVLHSDEYAEQDLLDFEAYAKAIQQFISIEATRPPLTIGVMAPWGKGKTTLMHFIEKKIKASRKIPIAEDTDKSVTEESILSRIKELQEWLGDNIFDWLRDKIVGKKTEANNIKFSYQLEYPIIWFNAWRFQKTQEVWAAFANEIIQQLVKQLPDKKTREEFWFKLNLSRIDKDAIRDALYKKAFSKISLIAISVLFGIGALGYFVFHWSGFVFAPTATIAALVSAFFSWKNIKEKTPNVDLSAFLVQPTYKKDMGYFYQLEQDLVNVFRLLVKPDTPPVIFIDDLDRCSPTMTAEIVEAINVFISSEDLKCYFILGQDAQMVAAALDAAYEKIGSRIGDNKRNRGSLGWAFMEKFVQLQFCIPVLSPKQRNNFLSNLMAIKGKDNGSQKSTDKVKELEDLTRTTNDANILVSDRVIKLKEEVREINPRVVAEVNEKIIEKTAQAFQDNSAEVDSLVQNLEKYLGNSPRSIKRFVNLYRFYRFIQATGIGQDMQKLDPIILGKWVVLMIRWPQLMRCIQWNDDESFLVAATPFEKANEFNGHINSVASYSEWEKLIGDKQWKPVWLKDQELFDYARTLTDTASLEKAFDLGIF